MIATWFLAAVLQQGVNVSHSAPEIYVEGEPYTVSVELAVQGANAASIPMWMLTPAAFAYNGRPVSKRTDTQPLVLQSGARLRLSYDLAPSIRAAENFDKKNFRLAFGDGGSAAPKEVRFFEAAEKGIDFMTLPEAQLADYQVVMRTSRGIIWLEMWPDVAPGHVRNFLDLCYTGFYDGTIFHRVIPTFMVQGGRGKPGMQAPRTLKAEFSDREHTPGVLSAARLPGDVNSASSEFFIVHGTSPHLNGEYSAFGKVVEGMDVVDRIAQSGNPDFGPGDPRASKPPADQVIEKAIVVKTPRGRQ